jgi:hypothetical protein
MRPGHKKTRLLKAGFQAKCLIFSGEGGTAFHKVNPLQTVEYLRKSDATPLLNCAYLRISMQTIVPQIVPQAFWDYEFTARRCFIGFASRFTDVRSAFCIASFYLAHANLEDVTRPSPAMQERHKSLRDEVKIDLLSSVLPSF